MPSVQEVRLSEGFCPLPEHTEALVAEPGGPSNKIYCPDCQVRWRFEHLNDEVFGIVAAAEDRGEEITRRSQQMMGVLSLRSMRSDQAYVSLRHVVMEVHSLLSGPRP